MAGYFTSNIKKEIGENIRRARKRKGLKKVEAAAIADVNRSYYAKIEQGLANPTLEKLYKILKALDISSKEILPF